MNRPLMVFLIVGGFLAVARLLAGCAALTPAEQAQVASDGVKLSMCATEAHLCKLDMERLDAGFSHCWDEYVMCKTAHGFEGGAR